MDMCHGHGLGANTWQPGGSTVFPQHYDVIFAGLPQGLAERPVQVLRKGRSAAPESA